MSIPGFHLHAGKSERLFERRFVPRCGPGQRDLNSVCHRMKWTNVLSLGLLRMMTFSLAARNVFLQFPLAPLSMVLHDHGSEHRGMGLRGSPVLGCAGWRQ